MSLNMSWFLQFPKPLLLPHSQKYNTVLNGPLIYPLFATFLNSSFVCKLKFNRMKYPTVFKISFCQALSSRTTSYV